ncbi:MAG: hypothetical protein KDK62_04965 [Chlamydiia bacterium]|nr:hypothetical protein [Chlamydiia bacterium]
MATPDPFDIILKQIATLVDVARKKSAEPFNDDPVAPGIEKQLDFLEDFIQKMGEIADQELEKKQITYKDLARLVISERDTLSKDNKKMVERTLSLGHNAFGLKYALTMAQLQLQDPKDKKLDTKKTDKAKVKKRKAKFKKAQGNKTWKKV